MSFDFDKEYSKEWKNLGFYYSFDKEKNCWMLFGSQKGLLNFCDLLNQYANNPLKKKISEHEHFGPDSYLKVITWYNPIIRNSGIYGTLKDIQKLASIIKDKLVNKVSEDIIIDKEYSEINESSILLKVMDDDFDPSTAQK